MLVYASQSGDASSNSVVQELGLSSSSAQYTDGAGGDAEGAGGDAEGTGCDAEGTDCKGIESECTKCELGLLAARYAEVGTEVFG